jgi:hypothetical protein
MNAPLRIGLRLLGVVLLVLGIGMIVILFYPGPRDVADWMGNTCAHTKNGPSEQCNIFDVLEFIFVAPWVIIVGLVLALVLRPESKGTPTISFGGLRRK